MDFPVQFAISWMPQVNRCTVHVFLMTEVHMRHVGGNEGLDFIFYLQLFSRVCVLLLYMLME